MAFTKIAAAGIGSTGTVTLENLVVTGSITASLTGTATSTTNIPNLTGAITSVNTTTSLGSFSSANLSAALTDETGSGANVFAISPVLVTPSLGIATAQSLVVSGVTTVSSGTAALPSISPSGDPNTGVFFPAADHLNFSTGGTSRVQIDSDGDINIDSGGVFYDATNNRLAIGTTSPGSILHLQQSASAAVGPDLRLTNNAGTASDKARISFFAGTSTPNIRGALDFNINVSGVGELIWSSGEGSVTEKLRCDASGRLLVGASNAPDFNMYGQKALVNIVGIDGLGLERDGNNSSATAIYFKKSRSSAINGVTVVQSGDDIGTIDWIATDGSNPITAARISSQVDGSPSLNDMPGRLVFSTTPDNSNSPTERLRIESGGRLFYGTTSAIADGRICLKGDFGTNRGVVIESNQSSADMVRFNTSSGHAGTITSSGQSTTYATSSDYRIKENVVPLAGATDRFKQLLVHRFRFIAEPEKTVDGFIAHEVQTIVPEAIIGEKDAVDDDGKPVYQGIDQSKLVPLLTAALQEAIGEIESLKDRLTAAGI